MNIGDKAYRIEQTERIRQMEQRLERAATAVMELSAALDKYVAVQEDINLQGTCQGG